MSGAEVTIDEFLKELTYNGYECLSLNSIENYLMYYNYYDEILKDDTNYIRDEYKKVLFTNKDNFFEKIGNIINRYKPDLIISQLNGLKEIIQLTENMKIPIVYIFHSYFQQINGITSNYDLGLLENSRVKIICISNYIKNSLPNKLKDKSFVVYPIIKKDKYLNNKYNPSSILFVNPRKIKGIEIIFCLARKLSNETFKVYEIWGNIPRKYLDIMKDFTNIYIMKKTNDIKQLYKDTKLLLVPSQCPEGFGRVIVEANINSIPAVCSNVGGINEATGPNQILIDDYTNADVWYQSVREILSNKEKYERMCVQANYNSIKFNDSNLVSTIKTFLQT